MLRNGVALVFFGSGYLGVVFLIFVTYAVVYGRTRHKVEPAAVVILGSQLIEGRVPPLLRARLDRALEIYRQASEPKPLLIPSGGQGADEPRPEGEGMAEYLLEQGAAPADVLPEEQAVNTEQNLRLSATLHDDAVRRGTARPGPLLVSTDNYHVLRAALPARRLKLDAEVVGARTVRLLLLPVSGLIRMNNPAHCSAPRSLGSAVERMPSSPSHAPACAFCTPTVFCRI